MKKLKGKIILVDDETYEKELLKLVLIEKHWGAEVEYFKNAENALDYLKKTKDEIFLIISDWNMPKMNGLDFKRAIDSDIQLRKKALPFIFATTSSTKEQVAEAYDYRVQGFFTKPLTVDQQAEMLDTIIRYWVISLHPNKKDF